MLSMVVTDGYGLILSVIIGPGYGQLLSVINGYGWLSSMVVNGCMSSCAGSQEKKKAFTLDVFYAFAMYIHSIIDIIDYENCLRSLYYL